MIGPGVVSQLPILMNLKLGLSSICRSYSYFPVSSLLFFQFSHWGAVPD